MTSTVRIIGESGNQIEVPTHMVDGAIVLSGSWFDVVESEKIVYGDIGLFVHYAPNHLALFLFDPNGSEKPMARRSEFWSPQTAYENHAALYRNPIAQSILVAHPMMHMRFDHSNSTDFTWPILSTMLQLWINNPISYPLYAVRLNHSNVNKYQFYLNSRVSKWFLPEVAVRFYDEDSEMEVEGILKKDDNQMKAFGGVWREMVQLYGYRVGEVLVLAMRDELDGVVSIRVYPVEEQ